MATVTALVDRVCQDTGLDPSTGAGGERSVALDALNEAYEIIAEHADLNLDESSVALTQGQFKYGISTDLGITDLFVFNSLWYNGDAASNEPLTRIKMEKMRMMLTGELIQDAPQFYAVRGDFIWFSTPPAAADTLFFEYLKDIPELVENAPGAGEEDTPSLIHKNFHRSVLARLAVSIVLENYEGREDVAQLHRQRAEEGMARVSVWTVRKGGIEGPRDTAKRNRRMSRFRRGNDVY